MQIHQLNLADYISKALILPSKYIEDRTELDIQTKNNEGILLSDGYFNSFFNDQILLELILTKEEEAFLRKVNVKSKLIDEIKIYNYPISLPISRVKTIYLYDKEIQSKLESTFNTGDVGYLPFDKIKIVTKKFLKQLPKLCA